MGSMICLLDSGKKAEDEVQCTEPPRPPPLCPQLPWLMRSFDEGSDVRSFLSITDGRVHHLSLPLALDCRIVGSVDGWLVLVNGATAVYLLDPIKKVIINLPPLTTMSKFIVPCWKAEGEYDICNFADEYVFDSKFGRASISSSDLRDSFMQKLILTDDGMAVACMTNVDGLAFARAGDKKWTVAGTSFGCTDMLCYKGQLYAVDRCGVVARCDVGPPATVTPITSGAPENNQAYCWYMVESSGELLLVARYCPDEWKPFPYAYPDKKFQVFKLDRLDEEAELVEVKGLGDRMLFLGSNRTVSLDARDYPGCRGNRIYFTSNSFNIFCDRNHECDDFGVFNMEDGSIESIPCYPDRSRLIWPPPIWFTPSRS